MIADGSPLAMGDTARTTSSEARFNAKTLEQRQQHVQQREEVRGPRLL